jgi:hypothetical protein
MRLPGVRFTVRRMMVAVAIVAVALAYLGTGTTRLGCGETDVLLSFQVIDDLDGRPVSRASMQGRDVLESLTEVLPDPGYGGCVAFPACPSCDRWSALTDLGMWGGRRPLVTSPSWRRYTCRMSSGAPKRPRPTFRTRSACGSGRT